MWNTISKLNFFLCDLLWWACFSLPQLHMGAQFRISCQCWPMKCLHFLKPLLLAVANGMWVFSLADVARVKRLFWLAVTLGNVEKALEAAAPPLQNQQRLLSFMPLRDILHHSGRCSCLVLVITVTVIAPILSLFNACRWLYVRRNMRCKMLILPW